jgi:GH24 family phage-related lysozyme (muramidase)
VNANGPEVRDQKSPPAGPFAVLVRGSAVVVAFVAGWERDPRQPTVVYADPLAKSELFPKCLPTVCSGLTPYITDTPMVVGEDWGEARCTAEERVALAKVQRQLMRCFIHVPPQSVFDAGTSHAWNFGVRSTCGSSGMREWNQGQWSLGCERLAVSGDGRRIWSYAGGKFVRGLANRRAAEVRLCKRDLGEVVR